MGVVRLLVDSVTVTAAVAVAVGVLVEVYVIITNSVAVLLGSTDTVIVDSTPPLAVMAVAHGVGMESSVSSNPDSVARVATISVVGKLQISVVVSVVNGSVAQVVTSVSLAVMTHVSSSKIPVSTPRFLPESGHADEGGRIGISWPHPGGREGRWGSLTVHWPPAPVVGHIYFGGEVVWKASPHPFLRWRQDPGWAVDPLVRESGHHLFGSSPPGLMAVGFGRPGKVAGVLRRAQQVRDQTRLRMKKEEVSRHQDLTGAHAMGGEERRTRVTYHQRRRWTCAGG